MSAFNPMDGVTIAKNPWRNSKYGSGTHYFRTSNPRESNTEAQQQVRRQFARAAENAAEACSGLDGMARNECQLEQVADEMRGSESGQVASMMSP